MEHDKSYLALKKNCDAVRKVIEQEVLQEDPDSLVGKLHDLVNIKGLSANNLANARILWSEALEFFYTVQMNEDGTLPKSIQATVLKELVKAKAGKFESLYEYAERLDKGVSYAIEGLRTMISLYKTELEESRKGN